MDSYRTIRHAATAYIFQVVMLLHAYESLSLFNVIREDQTSAEAYLTLLHGSVGKTRNPGF